MDFDFFAAMKRALRKVLGNYQRQHRQVGMLLCLILIVMMPNIAETVCNRRPQGAHGDRSPVDESFSILIDGNPASYMPGQQYNISLSCTNNLKFISFTMVIESENAGNGLSAMPASADMLGHFEIIDVAETKFSVSCENMLESTNTNPKSRIDVAWVAPNDASSGCVYIKAAVLQHRNVWFVDDGFLTKRICPEEIDEINSQTPPVDPCCACDEAKYEIILERKWTRNTHAKDFPMEAFRTRFSEIIGASHSLDYRFWSYWSPASRGLKELAEHGATTTLENEIKASSLNGSIRTIIKAPGIVYKLNSMGSTLAHVRVDANHHVVSLVSKIDPSPDWILGVAGLELCLSNCTWISQKVLNLYPWDVGTDAGPSYMSPDQPQYPADVVRRITSTHPSDYRSPFYDESGAPMKPMATLYVTRKKLYERECEMNENLPMECAVHPWNAWNECSTKCGPGTQVRIRAYKDPQLAENFNCQVPLREAQDCIGMQCGLLENSEEQPAVNAECELGTWSDWSQCSMRCGKGFSTRSRDFVNPYARDRCLSGITLDLQQSKECYGEDCGGSIRPRPDEATGFEAVEEETPDAIEENPYEINRNINYNRNFMRGRGRGFSAEEANNQNSFEAPQENAGEIPILNSNSNLNRFNTPLRNDFDAEENTQNRIYGSEKLVGNFQRGFAGNTNARPAFGNFAPAAKPQMPTQQFAGGIGSSNENFFNQANRRPFDNQRGPTPYKNYRGNDFRNVAPGFNEQEQQNSYNNADPYNSFNNAATSETTPEIPVLQDYCFEKPNPPELNCNQRKIIVGNYWFYDAEDQMCKLFTTNNCDDSKNKFRTLDACDGTCAMPHKIIQEANAYQQPPEPQSQVKVNRQNIFRNRKYSG